MAILVVFKGKFAGINISEIISSPNVETMLHGWSYSERPLLRLIVCPVSLYRPVVHKMILSLGMSPVEKC